jgi:hypothetical protein
MDLKKIIISDALKIYNTLAMWFFQECNYNTKSGELSLQQSLSSKESNITNFVINGSHFKIKIIALVLL